MREGVGSFSFGCCLMRFTLDSSCLSLFCIEAWATDASSAGWRWAINRVASHLRRLVAAVVFQL